VFVFLLLVHTFYELAVKIQVQILRR